MAQEHDDRLTIVADEVTHADASPRASASSIERSVVPEIGTSFMMTPPESGWVQGACVITAPAEA